MKNIPFTLLFTPLIARSSRLYLLAREWLKPLFLLPRSVLFVVLFVVAILLPSLQVANANQRPQEMRDIIRTGKVSWYGTTAQGKLSASGTAFNKHDLTAAHKSLPFGTVLRVVVPATNRQVLVQVKDRGPYGKGRIVDVSKKAASRLGIVSMGVASCSVDIVSDKNGTHLSADKAFYVRLAEANTLEKALSLATVLEVTTGMPVRPIQVKRGKSTQQAICIGPFKKFNAARKIYMDIDATYEPIDIIEAPIASGTAQEADISAEYLDHTAKRYASGKKYARVAKSAKKEKNPPASKKKKAAKQPLRNAKNDLP